jgi:hypothetical protein
MMLGVNLTTKDTKVHEGNSRIPTSCNFVSFVVQEFRTLSRPAPRALRPSVIS